MPASVGIDAAFDFSNPPPMQVRWITVLLIASDFAGAAADALCHVEMKTILFARKGQPVRNKTYRSRCLTEFRGDAHQTVIDINMFV